MPRDRAWPILLLLPAAFFAAEWWLRAAALPYWLWFNLDPSYAYLIGGLNLLHGLPPAQFQHPGSPVQVLTALAAWATPGDPVALAETILTRSSTAMFALNAAALAWLGLAVRRRFGALLPAVLAQLAPFVTMLALKHGLEVEPEPLLLFSAVLLSIGLVEESFADLIGRKCLRPFDDDGSGAAEGANPWWIGRRQVGRRQKSKAEHRHPFLGSHRSTPSGERG